MAGMLAQGMSVPDEIDKRQRGLAVTALLVGSMVLARTIDNEAFCNEVREAARTIALDLVG
jgi:hypothetical protein